MSQPSAPAPVITPHVDETSAIQVGPVRCIPTLLNGKIVALSLQFSENEPLTPSQASRGSLSQNDLSSFPDRAMFSEAIFSALRDPHAFAHAILSGGHPIFDFSRLTPFQKKVFPLLLIKNPSQRVTYGSLSSELHAQTPKKVGKTPLRYARAIGRAMATNPFPLVIPCHRVLAMDGSLGGFLFGLEMKKALLENDLR